MRVCLICQKPIGERHKNAKYCYKHDTVKEKKKTEPMSMIPTKDLQRLLKDRETLKKIMEVLV